MKRTLDAQPLPPSAPRSLAVRPGGELHLSNPGQLELLRAMMERCVRLRTSVRGSSMSPFVRDKDVLTIAPMGGRLPRVGEVIAFVLPDTKRLAIHRVIARKEDGWLVKGDNCRTADGVVSFADIVGRVIRVERAGHDVRAGCLSGGACIAALNRGGNLMRLRRLWLLARRTKRLALRLARAVPPHDEHLGRNES